MPDFLLIDHTASNLDRDGRGALCDMLSGWRGGALVVSHDRELLDAMDASVGLITIDPISRAPPGTARLRRADKA